MIIMHSKSRINCSKIISQLDNGSYLKYYNKFLIPYLATDVVYDKKLILGRFVNPMWNILERAILMNDSKFKYSYACGKDFKLETSQVNYSSYSILGRSKVYSDCIIIPELLLKPNSILLFPLDRRLGETLINNWLI